MQNQQPRESAWKSKRSGIIDVNVSLSRWPFRRLPCDELPRLVDRLGTCGVAQAWVGSFDGVFHKDIGGVNARLVDQCRRCQTGLLVPFGTVNPTLPDWREDLRRCDEDYRMPGIRLHPNYHGYSLDAPVFAELLTRAEQRGLMVQLAVRMEDPRVQHSQMQVADVDVQPLPDLIAARPKLRLVMLNALQTLRSDVIDALTGTGQVCFDISILEGVRGIAKLLDRVSVDRILFGSHFPFFILESAVLKLQESELLPDQSDAITRRNAQRLLRAGSGS